jgi:hypothetical protein
MEKAEVKISLDCPFKHPVTSKEHTITILSFRSIAGDNKATAFSVNVLYFLKQIRVVSTGVSKSVGGGG